MKKTSALSFKEKQRIKKEEQAQKAPPKQVESLADRRKNRKNLIDENSVNELGSELEKLKKAAGSGSLEEVAEVVEQETNLEMIKEEEVDETNLKESILEPENNLS